MKSVNPCAVSLTASALLLLFLPFFLCPSLVNVASATDENPGVRAISGVVSMEARVELPPSAELAVEAVGFNGESLAVFRERTGGSQVPLSFELMVPVKVVAELRAAVFVDGRARWVGEGGRVAPGVDPVDAGTIMLRPFAPYGFASDLLCGERRFRVGFAGDKALLDTGREVIELQATPSASGARFQSGDGLAGVWTKGDRATVRVDGKDFPECRVMPPKAGPQWTARGNEPGWNLTMRGRRLTLVTDYGAKTLNAALDDPVIEDGAFVYASKDSLVHVRVVEEVCHDTMTGMPYPQSVTVEMGEGRLAGCGGNPMDLLAGAEWVVEDVLGGGIIDSSRLTMRFEEDGRLAGTGGCNRYSGQVSFSGEGLSIGPLRSTRMSCAEALDSQERRFLGALASADAFDIDETGALLLLSRGSRVILARRL